MTENEFEVIRLHLDHPSCLHLLVHFGRCTVTDCMSILDNIIDKYCSI